MSEECKDCVYYGSVDKIRKELQQNKEENIKQDASLKAIHKRLDEDNKIRQSIHEKTAKQIDQMATKQATSSQVVEDHMEWEEKHQKLVFKVGVSILSMIFAIVGAILLLMLSMKGETSSNKANIKSVNTAVEEIRKDKIRTLTKIEDLLEKQSKVNFQNSKLIYTIQANQKILIDRRQ